MSNLVSCQDKKKNECTQSGFCVQDTLLYYNQKQIYLGMPSDKFVEALGKYDREVIDSSGGEIIRDYFWKKKMISVNKHSDNNYFRIAKMKKDAETSEITEDYNEKTVQVKTLEEIIKKYGKFDSYTEEKSPLRINKFYIWDKIGIDIAVNVKTEEIENIFIQTLLVKKIMKIDMESENDIKIFNKSPKQEYKGNFTYNGNTVNLKEVGYENWETIVSKLKISGESYNPPGDSPNWSRVIRESDNLNLTMERFTNLLNEVKPKDKIDGIKGISIWKSWENE